MTHPTPDDLVLAALPAECAPAEVLVHLRGCAECAAQVASWRRTVSGLRDTAPFPPGPPPALWDRVLAGTRTDAAGTSAPRPPPAAAPSRASSRRVPLLVGAVGAVGVVLLVLLVGLLSTRAGSGPGEGEPTAPPDRDVALVASQAGVRGTFLLSPGRGMLDVDVVLPAPLAPGEVLEVWRVAPGGAPEPLGVLRVRSAPSEHGALLPVGPGTSSMRLDVSVEDRGGPATHSGRSVAHWP